MRKIILMTALITVLAAGVSRAAVDQFVFTVVFSSTTTGVAQTANIEARQAGALMSGYTGTAFLSAQGGGDVIVEATGTSQTPAFTGGVFNGNIKILKAGTVSVLAEDSVIQSATGLSAPVAMLPAPYQKLIMLVDDMVFAPGTVAGHIGAAKQQQTHVDFPATVYACDNWNNPVVPGSPTGIRLDKAFSGGYIAVTPYCDALTSYDLYGPGVSSITFTVSAWPNPNLSQPRAINAIDDARGYTDQLTIDFISSDSFYYNTSAPFFVTAGVPFNVTVRVSNFPAPNKTPDTTFVQSVDLKALSAADASDAVPVICNAALTPQPTPVRTQCVLGEAYFNVAYTKAGNIYMKPLQVGATPVVNSTDASCYSPLITVGSAAPRTYTFTSAADRLQRNVSTQLTVRPYDVFGNPVSGTAVNFAILCGAGTLSTGTANTNGFGVANINYTAPAGNFANIIYASVAPVAVSQSVTILSELTDKFQNWPNPFMAGKETTKINYALTEDSAVTLRLYSSFGKLAWSKDIAKGYADPVSGENQGRKGGNTVIWNGTGDRGFVLGAGVYLLRMTVKNSSGTSVQTRHITIVK